MKKNTTSGGDENAPDKKISLRRLIEESVTLKRFPDAQKKILEKLPGLNNAQKKMLKKALLGEREKVLKIEEKERALYQKLYDYANGILRQIKVLEKKEKHRQQEEQEKFSEENFAKQLMDQLERLE